jgi:hypothetical protein
MLLSEVFDLVVGGRLQDAMTFAHQHAERCRQHQDNQGAQWAGKVWTVANVFSEIQRAISQEAIDTIKDKASLAGDLIRALQSSGQVGEASAERALQVAGGYWTLANKAVQEKSGTNSKGAAAKAQNSETVEQYKLPTNRTYAHCGIATSMMLLQANGKGDLADANQLVSEMYLMDSGTDVDLMAKAMRKRGLDKAQATRSGTFSQLMATLKSGQPVPFGISHSVGEVVKMNGTPSKYYSHYRPGSRHARQFGSSGHWVLVVGFEGSPENPTHFIFNDPDVGGQLRATKAELEQMGVGNGQFFQVTQ